MGTNSQKRFQLKWSRIDIIAIISTFVIAAVCSLFVYFLPSEANDSSVVRVYHDGILLTEVNLLPKENEKDPRYIILFKGEKTDQYDAIYPTSNDKIFDKNPYLHGNMVIRIQDGVVKVVEETCPKNYCSMGEISRHGQTLTCDPNIVRIIITSNEKVYEDPPLEL